MKKILIAAAVGVLIATVLVFVIFNTKDIDLGELVTGPKTEIRYHKSYTIHLPMEKVRTLNPVYSFDEDTYHISKLIYESLFYLDSDLGACKGLVEEYSYNQDRNQMLLKIRNNSRFSDGSILNATDVKYSIDSYIRAYNSGKTLYASYVSNIKSVEETDDYELIIKYKDKGDMSVENLIFPIVSKESRVSEEIYNSQNGVLPLGSGPYMLESYNDISELKLVANKYYCYQKPINELKFMVLPEKDKDLVSLLDVNSLSFGILKSVARDTQIADKEIRVHNIPSNEAEVIGFNFNSEFSKIKKMRQVVAYVLDTDEINESIYYKNGINTESIYFPTYMGKENRGDQYKYNQEKAEKIIEKYRASKGQDDTKGTDIKVTVLVNNQFPERVLVADNLKEKLQKLGIICDIKYAKDGEEFVGVLNSGEYDLFVGGLKINETYDLRSLLHSEHRNAIHYKNPKLDSLMDRMKSGISPDKKKEILGEINDILVKDLPYYCILYKTYGGLSAKAMDGSFEKQGYNNIYGGCGDWYCKYPETEPASAQESIP